MLSEEASSPNLVTPCESQVHSISIMTLSADSRLTRATKTELLADEKNGRLEELYSQLVELANSQRI